MNDNKPYMSIDPPKVSLIDALKYKLGYFQGRSRVITTVVGVTLMAGVSMFIAYASLNRRNVSLNPDDTTGAANPSCLLTLNLRVPTPSPSPLPTLTPKPTPSPKASPTPKPTKTPKPTTTPPGGICTLTKVPSDHQAICYEDPREIVYQITFNSLPTDNPPYYLQTDWYIDEGGPNEHHYAVITDEPVVVGKTYYIYAQWPGLAPYPGASVVDMAVLYNLYDRSGGLIDQKYQCSGGINYFWSPWNNCP